ncbi:hypothetical protein PoB_003830900 [Plakobranchus ocellatus]|uniref:Uncharacterized protein n=1 Tax=Plakobranchus ocellatus TaxID=259542 RepID=A0AAV4B0C3_9GAST|nr:hypothetical protein PoB_003830900 [Plakobranchus ocellatus]
MHSSASLKEFMENVFNAAHFTFFLLQSVPLVPTLDCLPSTSFHLCPDILKYEAFLSHSTICVYLPPPVEALLQLVCPFSTRYCLTSFTAIVFFDML